MSLHSAVRTVALAAITLVALAGCSATVTSPPPTAAAPSVAPAAARPSAPPSVPVAKLPAAPPVESWVVKGKDFQQTLDLRLQTELIELGVPVQDATAEAARALAYFVCSGMRQKRGDAPDLIAQAYPAAATPNAVSHMVGLGINAQGYCLDQFGN